MFNLSTVGNVGYNGISQLSESRCTARFDPAERTATSSGTKMRFDGASGRGKYTTGFKMPLYTNIKNASPDARLKLPNPKEDVYAFDDADAIVSSAPNSFLKESLASNKTDTAKKTAVAGGLLTSSKRVPIGKPINGYNFWKHSVQKNGVHKPPASGESSKGFHGGRGKCQPKQPTGKESTTPQQTLKNEPNDVSASNLHNADSSKNSIISYSNIVPAKSVLMCQDKKINDVVVKKENASKGGGPSVAPIGSNKNLVKTPVKKPSSGKPPALLSKTQKGRGPALHEALQRINPSISTLPSNKKESSNDKWHAPGTELFDCGSLSTTSANIDSDSSDDYTSDCVDCLDSDDSDDASDRSEKIAATRTKLRKKISLLNQLRKISSYSESAIALYNSVKTQMRKQGKMLTGEGFRLESSTLDLLLASHGSSSLITAADKRRIKYGNRTSESTQCAPSSSAHNAERRLSSGDAVKSSDSTQSRVPVLNIKSETNLSSEHLSKNNSVDDDDPEAKSKKSSRKRSQSSTSKPPKRNSKKKPSVTGDQNDKTVRTDEDTSKLKEDVNLFSASTIRNDATSDFLNHENAAEMNVCTNPSVCDNSGDNGIGSLNENELINSTNHNQHIVDPDVVAEVLALHESGDLASLDLPAVSGPVQDAKIDFSTVFNEILTEPNGEYIPTREETEELERALEAVNQDVKSLEKLTNSQIPSYSSLLDMLDEKALAETLGIFPDEFSNITPVKAAPDAASSSS